MNRGEARALWQRVADGDTDAAVMTWLRQRAAAIVEADAQPAGARRDAIVRAAGLSYKVDALQPLADVIAVANDFDILDDTGRPREPRRGEAMRILMDTIRGLGLVSEEVADHELRKRIERAIARDV